MFGKYCRRWNKSFSLFPLSKRSLFYFVLPLSQTHQIRHLWFRNWLKLLKLWCQVLSWAHLQLHRWTPLCSSKCPLRAWKKHRTQINWTNLDEKRGMNKSLWLTSSREWWVQDLSSFFQTPPYPHKQLQASR